MVGTDFYLKMRAKIRRDVGKRVLLRGKKHQKEAMPTPQFFWGGQQTKNMPFLLIHFFPSSSGISISLQSPDLDHENEDR